MVTIKVVKLHPDALLPKYAHTGTLGDLCADLAALMPAKIKPQEVKTVRTGIAMEFPEGYGALIEDRSGLAQRGLCTLGGVIDPGYRGELQVVLANLGQEGIEIAAGDRIAQLRIVQKSEAHFVEVEQISPSGRGTAGFGSTGQ